MSKQIYIDSNGNEVLVSGTVNSADMLPLEAGSSKMTSEAIDDLKTEAVTFTPSTGITLNYSSIGKTDKQVGGSIICKYSSFVVGTWKELGYISATPTDDIKTCSANNTTGQFAGMVRFETNGKVSVYPQQSGEYAVAFSFAYITA